MAEWIDIKRATPTTDTEVQFRLKHDDTVRSGRIRASHSGFVERIEELALTLHHDIDNIKDWRFMDGVDWQASFLSAEKSWNIERKRANQLEQELKEMRARAQSDITARLTCHIKHMRELAKMNYELAACQALSDEERSEFRIIAHTQEALAERLERTLG